MHWKTSLGGRNKRHFSAERLSWAVAGVPSHMCPVEVIHPYKPCLLSLFLGGPVAAQGLLCACAPQSREHWADLSVHSCPLTSSWSWNTQEYSLLCLSALGCSLEWWFRVRSCPSLINDLQQRKVVRRLNWVFQGILFVSVLQRRLIRSN